MPQLQAQVHILLAKAHQGLGLLERAADEARAAVDLLNGEDDVEIAVKARQALIAALADSGRLDEAWAESLIMADVISGEVDDQLVGKAYWVIGNVAFLCSKIPEGLHYHELAAATFSPARNLTVWAKFNKASAAMRLAADVADADTLRCIERAELATDVIGGSPNDFLLLKLNRGHWNYLAGEPEAAAELLEQICVDLETPSPQILGEAFLLLGRSHAALGNAVEAKKHLMEAADYFEKAGAPQRAEQALEFLNDVP
jgi:tetratricopeptide (TPR) repeat protein